MATLKNKMDNDIEKVLISEEELNSTVSRLAESQ